MNNKVMTMKEAVSRFVDPGDTLFVGGAQHGTPNAAVAEIVRQKINHLTVIAVLNNTGALVGEGLVDKVLTGYSMTDIKRSFQLQRARDKFGVNVEFREYSHFGIALALYAGYMGVPFLPTQSHLGSDMMKYNDEIQTVTCPFTGKPVAVIKAVVPDAGVIHVQRCDAEGNAQRWGTMGVDFEGINASRKVIITTEEVVDHDVIQRDSNRTLITGCRVSAVVEQPYGAFPTHLVGCYHSASMGPPGGMMQGEEAWENYVEENFYGVRDWNEYLENQKKILGDDFLENMKINNPMYSEPAVSGL